MTLSYGDPQNIVNIPALVRCLAATEHDIRAHKKLLRTTWIASMHETQRALGALKARATGLCALRALTRGRHHITRRPKRGLSPHEDWEAGTFNLRLAQRALVGFERSLAGDVAAARPRL